MPRNSVRTCAALALLLLIGGCGPVVQTSSGAAFVQSRPEWAERFNAPSANGAAVRPAAASAVDRAVLEAANAEPLLRFPARLGLARLQRGALTAVPPAEADAWIELIRSRGEGYGEFVVVSPLVAQMSAGGLGRDGMRNAIDVIRIGAARQHVDAVLIYEVGSTARNTQTSLSVVDLTIIGAFLIPSRALEGRATAAAMLIDVRNGYPYGTAIAHAEQQGSWATFGSAGRGQELTRQAELDAVRKLTTEVGTMVERLRRELPSPPHARTAAAAAVAAR